MGATGTEPGPSEAPPDEAVAGTIAVVDTPTAPAPSLFIAVTRKVYAVPSVNPATVQLSGPDTHVQVPPAGTDVTAYEVIAAPPFVDGALQDTVALRLPAVADTPVGAPGTVRGVADADAALGRLLPAPLVATTVAV